MGHWWLSSYIYFNPLPRKEGDALFKSRNENSPIFQSTPS